MEKKAVKIVDTKPLERPFDRVLVLVVGRPDLGDEEDVFPGDITLSQDRPDRPFVEVDIGRVDKAEAIVECRKERLSCLPRPKMVGTIADLRDGDIVGEAEYFHGLSLFSSIIEEEKEGFLSFWKGGIKANSFLPWDGRRREERRKGG